MNQFIQRVANYIANEVLIKGLANSKTFQRFAVRTNKSLQDLHQTSTDTFNAALNDLAAKRQVGGKQGPPLPPSRGVSGFVSAFWKEVKSDLGMKS